MQFKCEFTPSSEPKKNGYCSPNFKYWRDVSPPPPPTLKRSNGSPVPSLDTPAGALHNCDLHRVARKNSRLLLGNKCAIYKRIIYTISGKLSNMLLGTGK